MTEEQGKQCETYLDISIKESNYIIILHDSYIHCPTLLQAQKYPWRGVVTFNPLLMLSRVSTCDPLNRRWERLDFFKGHSPLALAE